MRRLIRRLQKAGRAGRDDRGSSSVETAILIPIIVVLLFAAPQAGMWFYARQAATDAATAAARAAAMDGAAPGAGQAAGDDYLQQLATGTITAYTVTETDTPTTVTIRVRADVPSTIPLPGFHPRVDVTVTRARERFTAASSP